MMPFSQNQIRILLVCISFCFVITILIGLLPVSIEECNCAKEEPVLSSQRQSDGIRWKKDGSHRLAVLVPFRERFEELLQFVPHMNRFLSRQNVDFKIFVLNQVDRYRFNRAQLINVGFIYTKANFDYIAMHDVDLLPQNNDLKYAYPKDGPYHIASPQFHPKYHYDTFVGGILLVKREHFAQMDGMSNKYWGWGLEDDEFYIRIRDAGLTVRRPENITTGPENTFSHIHDRAYRKRDTAKCYNQKEVTRKRDRETGLKNLKYRISEIRQLTIDDAAVTVLNINLECDHSLTPWCDCSGKQK